MRQKKYECQQCHDFYPASYLYITEDDKVVCKECMSERRDYDNQREKTKEAEAAWLLVNALSNPRG